MSFEGRIIPLASNSLHPYKPCVKNELAWRGGLPCHSRWNSLWRPTDISLRRTHLQTRFWSIVTLLTGIASAVIAAERVPPASGPERRTAVMVELFTSEAAQPRSPVTRGWIIAPMLCTFSRTALALRYRSERRDRHRWSGPPSPQQTR